MSDLGFRDWRNSEFDTDHFDNFNTGVNMNRQPIHTPDISHIVTNLKRRAMIVILVIDVSGSMKEERIGAVNDAIRNLIPELQQRERSNTAAEIKLAILEFSSKAHWITDEPVPVSRFRYEDITDVRGGTNYGNAFEELNKKMNKEQFFQSTAGAYAPLIVFMTDGKPTDVGIYPEKLRELQANKWFQISTRAGIAIAEGASSAECKKALVEFTENPDNVFDARNAFVLARQIQLVTMTGVTFVAQRGSEQNRSSQTNVKYRQQSISASPTLPIDKIDVAGHFGF